GGEDYRRRGEPMPSERAPAAPAIAGPPPRTTGDFANLDFLADAAAVVLNLVPDKEGIVKVARKNVGPHAVIHVVAGRAPNTTYRSISVAEQPAKFLDLRLREGLNPQHHFTQQKQVSVLSTNQPFVLADVAAGRFEAYDSLPKVYGLYMTLAKDPKFAEFAFV